MTAVFSQLCCMETVIIVFMDLYAISQQVEYAILSSIVWEFNKDPDYPPPDQWGGQNTLEEDGYHFVLN